MKKLFTLTLSLLCFGAFAQQNQVPVRDMSKYQVSSEEVEIAKNRHNNQADRSTFSVYLDYPVADQVEQGAASVSNLIWTFNSRYDANDTDIVALNFIGTRLRDLVGYTDPTIDPLETYIGPFPYLDGLTITVDSIFALIGHENNSGTPDSFIVELRSLNAARDLLPNGTLVWADTLISSTSLSPSGNWLGQNALYTVALPCGYTTTGTQKVGVSLRYLAPETDTLGVLASYVRNPNGPSAPDDIALKTKFPNSYMRWMGVLSSNVVNTSNVFFPVQAGQDTSYFTAQNWQIWALATFEDATGIKKTVKLPLDMLQNQPNPFADYSTFTYTLETSQNLNLSIFDVNGRLISNNNLGFRSAGSYTEELPAAQLSTGTYFYQLTNDQGKSAMKKFTVIK